MNEWIVCVFVNVWNDNRLPAPVSGRLSVNSARPPRLWGLPECVSDRIASVTKLWSSDVLRFRLVFCIFPIIYPSSTTPCGLRGETFLSEIIFFFCAQLIGGWNSFILSWVWVCWGGVM